MSIAGRTMLLITAFLLLSGAQSPSFAQEKLIATKLTAPKSQSCSPLESVLLTQKNSCQPKKLTQRDSTQIAEAKEKENNGNVISYATDPTYYVPPVVTPTPTMVTVTAAPVQTATSLIEPPKDFVPAEGPSLNSDLILELINSHRATIGKAPFQKEGALCSLAQTRSIELHGELFGNAGYLHSGLYNRNLPYWITENAKWGSNESGTVNWWLNSTVHRRAIEGDYTYSCGACNGSQCAQLFTSFTPKGTIASHPIISPTQ